MADYYLEIRPPSGRRTTYSYEVLENVGGRPWVTRIGSMYATESEVREAGEVMLRWFRDGGDEINGSAGPTSVVNLDLGVR